MDEQERKNTKVAIIGSGLIGRNWAMLFAGAGFRPCMYDIEPGQISRALDSTQHTLAGYQERGLLRGQGTAAEQASRIKGTTSLQECLEGAFYVQECVPEDKELKKRVFGQIDDLMNDDTIVASSSSCLTASMFAENLKHRQNMLVAHPINPPYFLPLVEIVPAPFTWLSTIEKVRTLMSSIGQSPITLKYEARGFALNRIQYACINECWNMYKTGLLSAEDIDKVCTDGLGLRYAFIGPLETMHLNANGIEDYCKKFANGAYEVQQETFHPIPVSYDLKTARQIQNEFKDKVPLDKLSSRREWRDNMFANLARLKTELKKGE